MIFALAFSPDGKLAGRRGADDAVYVWNVEEKKLLAAIKDHGDWVLGVAFSADGKFLASAGADRDGAGLGGRELGSRLDRPARPVEPVYGVAFSPDGQLVALAVGGPTDRSRPHPPRERRAGPRRSTSARRCR